MREPSGGSMEVKEVTGRQRGVASLVSLVSMCAGRSALERVWDVPS